MIRSILIASLLPVIACAGDSDRRTWRWQQEVHVDSTGLIRLELPPPTLDASQPSLADLRILAPNGAEAAYQIHVARSAIPNTLPASSFKASMVDGATILEADSSSAEPITCITLRSPANPFLKSLQVEATNGSEPWTPIATSEVIFRDPSGVERLSIPILPASWQHLRVRIDDHRTLPVPFTGIQLTFAGKQAPRTDQLVTITERTEEESTSILQLDLGARNLDLAELKLDIKDPVYMRKCLLSYPARSENGDTQTIPITQQSIYRVVDEHGAAGTLAVIPIHRRIPSRFITLRIPNGDSPPLAVVGARATRYPVHLVFFASTPGTWKLLTGQPLATARQYDLSQLQTRLGPTAPASAGPLMEQANFAPPTTLPEITPKGATIDLGPWQFRKSVQSTATGIVEIPLDRSVLAHANHQLSDLRLVQHDNQIPFVISPASKVATLEPFIRDQPDPKRPQTSRWLLEIPIDNLPATRLIARSSTPLFNRQFRLTSQTTDSYGNPCTRALASAQWIRDPNRINEGELAIDLHGQRLPESLVLETDNGDNPPIEIDGITIEHSVPSILAKITDDAPLDLYYGNPSARFPIYDLDLVSTNLRGAEKTTATLGEEVPLKPKKMATPGSTNGSPWLWLALGGVVATLLFVVAKLLPQQAAGD